MNVEELTKELLKFNTINPPGDEEECIRYIGKLYEKNDFEVNYHKLSDKRYSLVVRKGHSNTKKPLCLTGHIDTVPLGSQVWTKDPFNGETDSGKLYGRGSSDMKAGIASIIDASLSVPIKEKSPGLEIVITAGEEIGCEGAFDLVKKSGALKKAGAVVVAEPTSNYPFVGHKGALWLKIKVNGITAHGSMPEKGLNAIYKISEIIEKIKTYTFNCKTHSLMGNPSLNLGTINGGLNINSVPDNAEITLDIRSVPTSTHEEIISSLKKLLGNEVEFETLLDVGSVCSEPSNVWIQNTLDIVRPYLGFRPDVKTATYFTDASALKIAYDNPPIIILGPGESAMAHKTDEYCLIDKIPESSSILKDIINNWNNG